MSADNWQQVYDACLDMVKKYSAEDIARMWANDAWGRQQYMVTADRLADVAYAKNTAGTGCNSCSGFGCSTCAPENF